jgi:hypothetical protein
MVVAHERVNQPAQWKRARAAVLDLLHDAEGDAGRIESLAERSEALSNIATEFALAGDLAAARRTALAAKVPADRLRAYAVILSAWAMPVPGL